MAICQELAALPNPSADVASWNAAEGVANEHLNRTITTKLSLKININC